MSLKPLTMDSFFLEKDNLISDSICDQILSRFSKLNDPDELYPDQPSRSSRLLSELDMLPDIWSDILPLLTFKIEDQIGAYLERFQTNPSDYYKFSHATIRKFNSTYTEDLHYNTEYAINHGDGNSIRNFYCILYLNDNFTGGEHVFPLQSKVFVPVKGKLVIYPTSLMFPNMSLPCYGGDKVLIRFNYHLDTAMKASMEHYEA